VNDVFPFVTRRGRRDLYSFADVDSDLFRSNTSLIRKKRGCQVSYISEAGRKRK
jgi:hypothetical protein